MTFPIATMNKKENKNTEKQKTLHTNKKQSYLGLF